GKLDVQNNFIKKVSVEKHDGPEPLTRFVVHTLAEVLFKEQKLNNDLLISLSLKSGIDIQDRTVAQSRKASSKKNQSKETNPKKIWLYFTIGAIAVSGGIAGIILSTVNTGGQGKVPEKAGGKEPPNFPE
ncbi:MAG: hypothetical protein HQK83_15670, partial [Fibrobacteria bacterium]|nr:hypothetical protein [Fibrobacteria bacterium]